MNTLNMGKQEVDWLDYVIPNSAAKSDIHLSLNGGNDKTTYYFSVGRTAEENTIGKGDYSRLNTKLALTSQVYKWLKLSADISVTQSVKKDILLRQMSCVWEKSVPIPPKNPFMMKTADGTGISDTRIIRYWH